ncbi:hypothetical protein ABZS66_23535 [Dactylosporangium sp. NPDC005572]|uniref:hypothetical protein n=1 Tax=Dactylosporangium sp. NPDC005572 TaxID=3156889 RepID=UPI0033ACA0E7
MVEPSDARTPRWVKVFAIAGVAVVVLVVVLLLTGHGPGRHLRHGGSRPVPSAPGGPAW